MSETKTLTAISSEGLNQLKEKAHAAPEAFRVVSKAVTVCRGGFLNETAIRGLSVMIDEPPHLLGTNTAPNPSEQVLAALGACLSVGYMANATAEGIDLEEIRLELEGDIDISPVWGVAHVPDDQIAGFTTIRVKATVKGQVPDDQLQLLHERVLRWSPVANTLRNPVKIIAELDG
ncbi:MAG: peroxiredoxin [Sulfobacillus thermosulfidooxidans]|nr:MAG: peroxiredoxin [Sulfobacillus thermosulfidooxidans]